MALSQQQLQQFDSFFSGQMNQEEKLAFYRELALNHAMQEEFELEKMLRGYTADIAVVVDDVPAAPVKKIIFAGLTRTQLAVAASLTGILLAGTIYYLTTRQTDKPPIVKKDKDAEIQKDSLKNKSNDSVIVLPSDEALLAYNENYSRFVPGTDNPVELEYPIEMYSKRNYIAAINEFNDFSGSRGEGSDEEKKAKVTVDFYKGLCLLELNRDREALTELNKAFKKYTLVKELKDDIVWYYAMACLKNKKINEAVLALQGIYPANKKYGKKAAELIKKLNEQKK
jgi:hypothetical protein